MHVSSSAVGNVFVAAPRTRTARRIVVKKKGSAPVVFFEFDADVDAPLGSYFTLTAAGAGGFSLQRPYTPVSSTMQCARERPGLRRRRQCK